MLEQRGVPTVVMGTFEFEQLAKLEAKNRGIEALPLALIPHPLGGIREDEVVKRDKPVAGPPSAEALEALSQCDLALVGSAD